MRWRLGAHLSTVNCHSFSNSSPWHLSFDLRELNEQAAYIKNLGSSDIGLRRCCICWCREPAFSSLHNQSILVSHQQSSIRKAQSRPTLPTFSSSISIKICPFDRSPVDSALLILMEDRIQQILVSWSCHVDDSYLHLPSCFNIVGPNIVSGHLKMRLLVSSSIFRTSVLHGRGQVLSHSRKCMATSTLGHPREPSASTATIHNPRIVLGEHDHYQILNTLYH